SVLIVLGAALAAVTAAGGGETVASRDCACKRNPAPELAAHAPRRLRRPPWSPALPRPGRAASQVGCAIRAARDAGLIPRISPPDLPFVSSRPPLTIPTPGSRHHRYHQPSCRRFVVVL